MLAKSPAVDEDDLRGAVDALGRILSTDPLGDIFTASDVARARLRDAGAERKAAEQALADALKRHGRAVDQWTEEPREVKAARNELEQARSREAGAAARLGEALERRDAQFFKLVMPQIEQAMPTLLDVADLVNKTVTPLTRLYAFAAGRNLSLPRVLMATPTLCDATRALVAAINFASAPAGGETK